MPRKTLDTISAELLVERLMRLTPEKPREWGTLTAHEMLCHLSDSFHAALGERQVSFVDSRIARTVIKFLALHTDFPAPKGMPTRPEVDPRRQGSRPGAFEPDRKMVIDLMRKFVSVEVVSARHPAFGTLTRSEWMIWGYRHVDHHLKQFGLYAKWFPALVDGHGQVAVADHGSVFCSLQSLPGLLLESRRVWTNQRIVSTREATRAL